MSGVNKRKRAGQDTDGVRGAPSTRNMAAASQIDPAFNNAGGPDLGDMSSADFSALQAHNTAHDQVSTGPNGAAPTASASDTASAALHYSMNVPQSTDALFAANHPPSGGNASDVKFDFNLDGSTQTGPNNPPSAGGTQQVTPTPDHNKPKPEVGSEEWHRIRRDNHKEVERRRRETINEGINELSKIVPGCEKNKGSILQRAVQYIQQLRDAEQQNIEKWTLEKLLTEQAIAELSASLDRFKAENERLRKLCRENDVDVGESQAPQA